MQNPTKDQKEGDKKPFDVSKKAAPGNKDPEHKPQIQQNAQSEKK